MVDYEDNYFAVVRCDSCVPPSMPASSPSPSPTPARANNSTGTTPLPCPTTPTRHELPTTLPDLPRRLLTSLATSPSGSLETHAFQRATHGKSAPSLDPRAGRGMLPTDTLRSCLPVPSLATPPVVASRQAVCSVGCALGSLVLVLSGGSKPSRFSSGGGRNWRAPERAVSKRSRQR